MDACTCTCIIITHTCMCVYYDTCTCGSPCVYKLGGVANKLFLVMRAKKFKTALSRDCWLVWPHHDSFFHACPYNSGHSHAWNARLVVFL